jgi:hypothetical protein
MPRAPGCAFLPGTLVFSASPLLCMSIAEPAPAFTLGSASARSRRGGALVYPELRRAPPFSALAFVGARFSASHRHLPRPPCSEAPEARYRLAQRACPVYPEPRRERSRRASTGRVVDKTRSAGGAARHSYLYSIQGCYVKKGAHSPSVGANGLNHIFLVYDVTFFVQDVSLQRFPRQRWYSCNSRQRC